MSLDSINSIEVLQHELAGHYHLVKAKAAHAFKYKSGQYCFLYYDLRNKELKRPYSIASAGNSKRLIEFCIADSDDHKLQKVLNQLGPGVILQISDAAGNFQKPEPTRQVCMIAGGSGIAPLRSMLLERVQQAEELPMTRLIFGSLNRQTLPYHAEFQSLANKHQHFQYDPVVQNNSKGSETLPTGNVLDRLSGAPLAEDYFLCGPPAMIDAAKTFLLDKGITEAQIFTDRY